MGVGVCVGMGVNVEVGTAVCVLVGCWVGVAGGGAVCVTVVVGETAVAVGVIWCGDEVLVGGAAVLAAGLHPRSNTKKRTNILGKELI